MLISIYFIFCYKLCFRSNTTTTNNSCIKKTCTCCTYSFDKFFKYINHNAYTIVSMEGIGFCLAASRVYF